jgi:dUTP pyrophosphatase
MLINTDEIIKYDTEVKFAREHNKVPIPTRREGDCGFDIYADPKWIREEHDGYLVINSLETVMIPTGLRTVIDSGYYAQIQERGSTGVKAMKYGSGVIDSSYRGVYNIVITNCSDSPIIIYDDKDEFIKTNVEYLKNKTHEKYIDYPVSKGIAQFLILPVPKVKMTEVSVEEVLADKTERGEGKLGSSGK